MTRTTRFSFPHPVPETLREGLVVCALVLLTLAAAGPLAARSQVMPAGDTFHFVNAAYALQRGTYPPQEKRLPVYPALIAILQPLIGDPVSAARVISTAALSLTVGVLYLLGRRLYLAAFPLALGLMLVGVQPVQLANGIRELSDSLFLLLLSLSILCAVSVRRSRAWVIGTAVVFALTALTRYEGVLAVALLLPFLRLRVPWKTVVVLTGIVMLLGVPWLMVLTRQYGAPWKVSYFDCVGECGYGAGVTELPARVYQLLDMTGWTRLWKIPQFLREQAREDASRKFLPELFRSSAWWVTVLGVIGFVWLLGSRTSRRAAFPVLMTLAVVALSVAWWKLHGRFTIVSLLLFSFLTAAGASAVWVLLHRFTRRFPVLRIGASLLATVFLLVLVRQEFAGLYRGAVDRLMGYQGSNFVLFRAIQAVAKEDGLVVFGKAYQMAIAYIGSEYAPNGSRALYLSLGAPSGMREEIEKELAARHPRWAVLDGSREMDLVAEIARERGIAGEERVYRAVRGRGPKEEQASVLQLVWPSSTPSGPGDPSPPKW